MKHDETWSQINRNDLRWFTIAPILSQHHPMHGLVWTQLIGRLHLPNLQWIATLEHLGSLESNGNRLPNLGIQKLTVTSMSRIEENPNIPLVRIPHPQASPNDSGIPSISTVVSWGMLGYVLGICWGKFLERKKGWERHLTGLLASYSPISWHGRKARTLLFEIWSLKWYGPNNVEISAAASLCLKNGITSISTMLFSWSLDAQSLLTTWI